MGRLDGRVVLVTGGHTGIGLGIAEGCAEEGADIVIWGRRAEKLEAAGELLSQHGTRVLAQRVDVTDEGAVEQAMGDAIEAMGRVDSVFANAGVHGGRPFLEQSAELWQQIFAVNVFGALFTFRAAARHMIDRGDGGALVGVGSISTTHGAPGAQPYSASKAAVTALVRGLAVELARYRIRCNMLVPGWTISEMSEEPRSNEKFLRNTTARIPVRRWGEPDDFRRAAAFLADPSQTYHTGDDLVLDGGYLRY